MAKDVSADNQILTLGKKFTFLGADSVAGATALNLVSTLGFNSLTTSSGQIVLVGELGNEKTEIIRTSSSTAPGGTGVTLNSALRFDHPQDTKVYIINWDRFEVQHATTITGTKTTLMAYAEALQPDALESVYRDTTKTSGYYFIRFNETIGSTNSDWSDAIPYGGYADNTVNQIKLRALERVGEVVDGQIITDEFLNRCLWEARRDYHQLPGKRPFRRSFNADIGNVTTGAYRVDLPSNCERPYTAENVFGVRVGANPNMKYIDKKEWDFYYINKPHAVLTTAYTVGDTDLYVDNARDFEDSGTVTVGGTPVEYSARSVTGGTLRISVQGDWAVPSGGDVWQNIAPGLPDRFTVWADPGGSAYIYFNRPFDTAYVNLNIHADYYRTVQAMDSDADELDEPAYDFYVPLLAAKIKKKRHPELELLKDSDYVEYLQARQAAVEKEYAGTTLRLTPRIQHLLDND